MSHFPDFNNMSARFDSLIQDEKRVQLKIPLSQRHHVFMSISRIDLFKTGGIDVELVSLSKSGALFSSVHHLFSKSFGKNITVNLALNGRHFEYDAHIVQEDAINDLYGIKFDESLHALDDYLREFHIHPHHEYAHEIGSIWLHFSEI